MTSRLNRSISTKVTDAEYEQIVLRANPKTVSEWAREILVLATTQRYMHLSPAAIEGAIRLLDHCGSNGGSGNIVATD